MYGFEPPLNLKPDWVASLETCPAIDGTGSKVPDANLVRWKAVFESVKDWHETGDPAQEIIARQFAWMDPVQKDITAAGRREDGPTTAGVRRFWSANTSTGHGQQT